jgi:cytochrome oxidase assembly protein ShyY1
LSISIPIGSRVFAPTWTFTVLTVVLCVAFFFLGRWQWRRGDLRQAEYDRFAAGAEQVIPLGSNGVDQVPRFQRVSVVGQLDPDHQFLLDNRSYHGRAGYEVLTPLERPNGRRVLVDRGWVPFTGLRERLPGVALKPRGAVTVAGRVDSLPSPGLSSGRAAPDPRAPWPKVTAFPSMAQLSGALGAPLEPAIVLLDPNEEDGYVRDWHPPGMEPIRHWSYAVQWWSFGVVLLVLWVGLSLRKIRQEP